MSHRIRVKRLFRSKILRPASWIGAGAAACLAGSCAPDYTLIAYTKESYEQSETFGYRKWIAEGVKPDVILIGIHGFCGASIDYDNLGRDLVKNQPKTGLYAYEVRGQGSDPLKERRGDIGNPQEWYRDLLAFTQLVKERHPRAQVVWYGESMGGLIAAHALREAPDDRPPCDGLILSSPVVRFRDDIPQWFVNLVQVASVTVPNARVSTQTLTGGQEIQMTQTSYHSEQVLTNSYHVEAHTLRLLGALANHVNTMNACAEGMQVPLLVLHGEKDFLNTDADVRGFVARVPEGTPVTYRNYPGAYHLLMYDAHREKVFRDVRRWVNQLRHQRL